jgi:hypothetical protein
MKGTQELLQILFVQTKQLVEESHKIKVDMEDNDPEKVENLLELLIQREKCIEEMKIFFQKCKPVWSEEELSKIKQIKNWDIVMESNLTNLFDSFSNQINKLQQGKHLADQYRGQYGETTTDGAYFDKRK